MKSPSATLKDRGTYPCHEALAWRRFHLLAQQYRPINVGRLFAAINDRLLNDEGPEDAPS